MSSGWAPACPGPLPVTMTVEVSVPVNPWTVKVRVPLKSKRRRARVKALAGTVVRGTTAARSSPIGPAQRLLKLTSGESDSLPAWLVIDSGLSGVDASAHTPAGAPGAERRTISAANPEASLKKLNPS
jgi:hypothetical protein